MREDYGFSYRNSAADGGMNDWLPSTSPKAQREPLKEVLSKSLFQMTGQDVMTLLLYVDSQKHGDTRRENEEFAFGITELAQILGCSSTTIHKLMKEANLRQAVTSKLGRKLVFDVKMARKLAREYTIKNCHFSVGSEEEDDEDYEEDDDVEMRRMGRR